MENTRNLVPRLIFKNGKEKTKLNEKKVYRKSSKNLIVVNMTPGHQANSILIQLRETNGEKATIELEDWYKTLPI